MTTEQRLHPTDAQPSALTPAARAPILSSVPPALPAAKRAPTGFVALAATFFYLACVAGPVPMPRYALRPLLAAVDAQREAIQSQIGQCVAKGTCVKTVSDAAGTYDRPAIDLSRAEPGSIACFSEPCLGGPRNDVYLQATQDGDVFAWVRDGERQAGFSYSPEISRRSPIGAQRKFQATWIESDWTSAE